MIHVFYLMLSQKQAIRFNIRRKTVFYLKQYYVTLQHSTYIRDFW